MGEFELNWAFLFRNYDDNILLHENFFFKFFHSILDNAHSAFIDFENVF